MSSFTPSILVVDDEPDLKLLITQRFRDRIKKDNWKFTFAHSAEEALKTLEQNQDIQLVLTDINMPNGSGIYLLDQLPKLKRPLKAMVISAYGDMSNVRMAMNRGAFDFIMKPIDFKELEQAIQRMIIAVKQLEESEEVQTKLTDIEKQLDVARSIQQTFIPRTFNPLPNNSHVQLFGQMWPAKHVGGDFFDFFPLDSKSVGFIVADVSGKGVPAALFMAVSRTLIRTIALKANSPLAAIREANYFISLENDVSMFVTAFYGVLDSETGLVKFCNAGHNTPLVLSKQGDVKLIGNEHGLPLGALEDLEVSVKAPYREGSYQMQKGDTLILYTDGVTEATSKDGNHFEVTRLYEALSKCGESSLQEISACVTKHVDDFCEGAEQSDDITLFCVRWT